MNGNVQSKKLQITQMNKILRAIDCSIYALCKGFSCCWHKIFAPKCKCATHLKWTCLHQSTSAQITNISLKKLRQRNYIILQKCRSYIDSMFSFDSRHASTFKAPHIHFHARVITESRGWIAIIAAFPKICREVHCTGDWEKLPSWGSKLLWLQCKQLSKARKVEIWRNW